MACTDLTWREAEDIIETGIVPGRSDLACVLELTAFMRASREVEPPPPMRADLASQIDGSSPRCS